MTATRTYSPTRSSRPSVSCSGIGPGFCHPLAVASRTVDEETRAALDEIRTEVRRLTATLDEFLPMIRAYLDPDQDGPRGWYMRRQLAKTNGKG